MLNDACEPEILAHREAPVAGAAGRARQLARTALAFGLTMAAGVSAIAHFRSPEVLAVVAITGTVIVLVGSLGHVAPLRLHSARVGPRDRERPLITSLADISGVLICFSIATLYLATA
jgi:magnesium transporter